MEEHVLTSSDMNGRDQFGSSVSMNGDIVVVGAPHQDYDASGGGTYVENGGAIYLFATSTGGELDKVVYNNRAADDEFGWDVSIEKSSDLVIVGAPYEDHDDLNSNYLQDAGSAFIAIPDNGNLNSWIIDQKIVANDRDEFDYFGYSVGVNEDHTIVGAPEEDYEDDLEAGAAYIFYNSSGWSQQSKLVGQNRSEGDYFGVSVDIHGIYSIVGEHREGKDSNGSNQLDNSGAAEIFFRDGTVWDLLEKLDASDRESGDEFGWSVAIDDEYAIVSAPFEDEDDNQSNTLNNSGSVYLSAFCYDPEIDIHPVSHYCIDDPSGGITLSVVAEGHNHGLTYEWYNTSTGYFGNDLSSQSVSSYGTYYVIVSNECGSITSNNAIITAGDPPGPAECEGEGTRKGQFDNMVNTFYPNPVKSKLFINKPFNYLRVFNQQGQEIDVNALTKPNQNEIDFSKFPNGVYTISLYSNNEIFHEKIIVIH